MPKFGGKAQLSVVEEICFDSKIWDCSLSPDCLPRLPGLYVIYNRADKQSLYAGQAEDLRKRCSHHPSWKDAREMFKTPCILFRIIERENHDELKRELLFSECLLIGLLRPLWNAGTPRFLKAKAMSEAYSKNDLLADLNLGDGSINFQKLTIREGVLLALQMNSHRKGLTSAEIKELLGRKDSDTSVTIILKRLVDRRVIHSEPVFWDRRVKIYSLPVVRQ